MLRSTGISFRQLVTKLCIKLPIMTSIKLLNKLIYNQAHKKIKLNSHACVSFDIESSNPETAEKTASTHPNNPKFSNKFPKVKEQNLHRCTFTTVHKSRSKFHQENLHPPFIQTYITRIIKMKLQL